MELLAPAGTMENFIAALESGADAIYLGGKGFNARAHAANFGIEELAEAIRLAHILDVSVYVTVNILIGDSELTALEEYLKDLERIGVDAKNTCPAAKPSSGLPTKCFSFTRDQF